MSKDSGFRLTGAVLGGEELGGGGNHETAISCKNPILESVAMPNPQRFGQAGICELGRPKPFWSGKISKIPRDRPSVCNHMNVIGSPDKAQFLLLHA